MALVSVLVGMAACGVDEPQSGGGTRNPDTGPNAGMFRDFIDGKFDSAGHPLNAVVVEVNDPDCRTCVIEVPERARGYNVTANLHLRVHDVPWRGTVATVRVLDANGMQIVEKELTTQTVREQDLWLDFPVDLQNGARVELVVDVRARVELAYVEMFPSRFRLVTGPGSGVLADTDTLVIEVPRDGTIDKLAIDDVQLADHLEALLEAEKATRTTTELRTIYEVEIGTLAPARGSVSDLRVVANGNATRMQIRSTPAECNYEGDAGGVPVLVTGFQAFPVNVHHENVSAVAVTALDPYSLRGARVMKLILPVEYDRAAAIVSDAIARCQPTHVLSFGQGGWSIALEQTAYNLQDTGELAGGVPDNRGIIRSATPIVEDGPAERATLLPLEAIRDALAELGEYAQMSTDPGRYICNNVMYTNLDGSVPGRAGFIHLPFTTDFEDPARWGRVVGTAVQATVDAD